MYFQIFTFKDCLIATFLSCRTLPEIPFLCFMKTFLSSLLLFLSVSLFAQVPDNPLPPYKQFPTAPPVKLLLADSTTVYTRDDLPKKKAVLFMLFSPECDHCRHQTDSILANINKFKNIQIVMATVLPFERLKRFYNEYQLEKYPNIVAGRDFQFLLPPFFKPTACLYSDCTTGIKS
ncbi:MAG: hypothetical protein NVV59_15265 [Chitinophagaceae bacterium]|nr:hypothetical protein [Chitinophagaceae bacterium]